MGPLAAELVAAVLEGREMDDADKEGGGSEAIVRREICQEINLGTQVLKKID